jgi:hypothetical protein
MAPRKTPAEVRGWLEARPSLEEMKTAYPAEWETVEREFAAVGRAGTREALTSYAQRLARPPARIKGQRRPSADALLAAEIRRHMAAAAIKQLSVSAATGVTGGRVRFNLLNGYVAQKLLFVRDLERKPVSLFWFRLVWPLLWQRRFLMPLVAPKGIYCFYSRRLVRALAELVGDRRCLEIAAGDGTLARFLADGGVWITATDDHSWRDVRFEAPVLRQDARDALRQYRPEVVICSWPPAGNPFEREVFETPSVQLYVVIGSRHRFASGDWQAYEQQTEFELAEDPRLSRLVLPPELEAVVLVFRRRP